MQEPKSTEGKKEVMKWSERMSEEKQRNNDDKWSGLNRFTNNQTTQ